MTAAARLLEWYRETKRELPWRQDGSPYGVLVSEIMLQQTQVERVVPFYERWMKRFPDFSSLASAPVDEVLLYWEGLGYYSRARNLHALAGILSKQYGGVLPRSRRELMDLPGIGPYTSAAVMCIAFGEAEPAVDSNAARVYSRLGDIGESPESSGGKKRIEALARDFLAEGPPGEIIQAVMELGALICRPRVPSCGECPLSGECRAYSKGNQSLRPVTGKRKGVVQVLAVAAVIMSEKGVLMYQRPPEGLLAGLWAFPAEENSGEEPLERIAGRIAANFGIHVTPGEKLCVVTHSYMNKKVTLHAFHCRAGKGETAEGAFCCWVPLSSLEECPLDAGSRKIAKVLEATHR
jgi:A/G-specific adenine glycosylase